jgi:hypothetical protein
MPLFLSPVYANAPDAPSASPPTISFSTAGSANIGGNLKVVGQTTLVGGVQGTPQFYGIALENYFYPPVVTAPGILANIVANDGATALCRREAGGPYQEYVLDESDTTTPTAWPWAQRQGTAGPGCWKVSNYASIGKPTRLRQQIGPVSPVVHISESVLTDVLWYLGQFGTTLFPITGTFVVGGVSPTVMDQGLLIPKAAKYYLLEMELNWGATPWGGSSNVAGAELFGCLCSQIDNNGSGGSGTYDDPTQDAQHQNVDSLFFAPVSGAFNGGVRSVHGRSLLPVGPNGTDSIETFLYLRTTDAVSGGDFVSYGEAYGTITTTVWSF